MKAFNLAVIIPVYNGNSFVNRCVDSMIAQDELSEIIFVDSGSTDGSYELLSELSKQDPRIQVLTNRDKKNSGVSAARNKGIQKATAEWVTFCDIDDFYMKDRFSSFAKADNDEVDIYHTAVKSIYEDVDLKNSIQEITACPSNFNSAKEMQNHLVSQKDESISIISMIVRRSALLEVGLFDESLTVGEDTDLIWKLAGRYTFAYEDLDSPKVIRQVHYANTYQDKEKKVKGRLAFYKKWRKSNLYTSVSASAQRRIREGYRHYRYVAGVEYDSPLNHSHQMLRYLYSKVLRM